MDHNNMNEKKGMTGNDSIHKNQDASHRDSTLERDKSTKTSTPSAQKNAMDQQAGKDPHGTR